MSNTIDQQTWQLSESLSLSVLEQQKADRRHSEQVVENKHLARLQKHEKDVVLPVDPQDKKTVRAGKKGFEEKPKLPSPLLAFNGFGDQDDDQEGLISIIGKVLALQAKTNSNFWSIAWKQASESMMMSVKFAPIIADAIKGAAAAQAAGTLQDASQTWFAGVANLAGFGGSIVLGTFMEVKDPEAEFKKPDPDNAFEVEGSKHAAVEAEAEQPSVMQKLDDMVNKTTPGKFCKRTVKAGWKGINKLQKLLTGAASKSLQASQQISMLVQGSTSLQASSCMTEKARQEALAGQKQAVSKEAEQYAQFYGQSFNRQEDLRSGSSQNIDYAMNIMKSAADSITQTVTSMFRG